MASTKRPPASTYRESQQDYGQRLWLVQRFGWVFRLSFGIFWFCLQSHCDPRQRARYPGSGPERATGRLVMMSASLGFTLSTRPHRQKTSPPRQELWQQLQNPNTLTDWGNESWTKSEIHIRAFNLAWICSRVWTNQHLNSDTPFPLGRAWC